MRLYVEKPPVKKVKAKYLPEELLLLAEQNPQKLVELLKQEQKARKKAEELSEIDDITELLLNRRGWKKYVLDRAYKLAKQNLPFCIFFIDLDRLKAVDDTFTNQHGTVYIQLFAQVLHETLRPEDIKSHPQGDEFFVLMPNVTLQEAKEYRQKVLENFHNRVHNLPEDHFFYEVPKQCEVGASIGIAYREWTSQEREAVSNKRWVDIEHILGPIIRETRLRANADSDKIKKKKKVIRDEARRRRRIEIFSSTLRLFGSLRAF